MADVLFVAVIIAFFGLCLGLVKLCDRLIGPDEVPSSDTAPRDERVAAGPEVAEAVEGCRCTSTRSSGWCWRS